MTGNFRAKAEVVVMNTSVSPLPIPIWPMLVLSVALVALTSVAVVFSGQLATRIYPAQRNLNLETEAPQIYFKSQMRARRSRARGAAL